MQVLNLGQIELVDLMGSDEAVVQAARISNGAVMPDWRGAPDERLIAFLAEHEHLTPFEHVVAKFYVKAPIFVVREWQRHRTFSYNELSGRYKELKPEFFIPDKARGPDPNNKQSSIDIDDNNARMSIKEAMWTSYHVAWSQYIAMLQMGFARELARSVLPVGIYTEMYVTGNLRNWMHFWELRSSPDAQYEIRVYADAVGLMLQEKFPIGVSALTKKRPE